MEKICQYPTSFPQLRADFRIVTLFALLVVAVRNNSQSGFRAFRTFARLACAWSKSDFSANFFQFNWYAFILEFNVNSRFHVNRSQIFFKQTRIRISSIHRSCAISHNLSAVSSSHPEQSWISNNNFLIFSVVFVCFFISLSLFLLQIVRDLALARYVLLRKIYRSSLPKSPYSTANPIVESSASQRRAIWTLRRFLFARAVIVVCADMRLVISQFI